MPAKARSLSIDVPNIGEVSGLWLRPAAARACLVLAHGAGAGMTHRSMTALAEGLAQREVATLRYQFPYMERGSKRPDRPEIAHAAVRAACSRAGKLAPELPLYAGGRSFGGRMTSQAQAAQPLPGLRGLVFFAFPLHPAGKPAVSRAEHLSRVGIPILFLQGTRDALAEPKLLEPVVSDLGAGARLILVPEADHAFHVPARSGRNDEEVLSELLDSASAWMLAPGPARHS
jgi:predicted alpha/beta-hydrolase family hydrolase